MVRVDSGGIKKPKEVNKNVVDGIKHKEYVDVVFGRGLMRHNMNRIQSKLQLGLMMLAKFLCSVFMISVIFLMMVFVVWLIFTEMPWVDIGSLACFCRDVLG